VEWGKQPMIELSTSGGRGGVVTDAGFFALWDPGSFHGIDDYDSWWEEVFEELENHEDAGALVAFHDADGRYQAAVRVGSAAAAARLDEREALYRSASSGPHLFVSTGTAVISGIEYVGDELDIGLRFSLPAGRWQVEVARIDWEAEPGSRDGEGAPSPDALPDFVLILNPDERDSDGEGERPEAGAERADGARAPGAQ
jgi:hypothetical protein